VEDAKLELLAELFDALGHEARLAVLQGLYEDVSMIEVADQVGMQRGSLQSHIDRLIRANLVYRPEESGVTYRLTPLGELAVEAVNQEGETVISLLEDMATVEKEIRLDFEQVPLDGAELEKAVSRELWNRLEEKQFERLTTSKSRD
jgi:DNA-binding transcriptional ArsR family regulator